LVVASAGPASASVSVGWTREFGTASTDVAHAVTHDKSGIYVVGDTSKTSVWVRKYSFTGSRQWTVGFDMQGYPTDVAVGGGSVYVSGIDFLGCGAYGEGGFAAAVTTTGSLRWTNQYPNYSFDMELHGVAADSSGAFFVGNAD